MRIYPGDYYNEHYNYIVLTGTEDGMMKSASFLKIACMFVPTCLWADNQSLFCPQNNSYIHTGMTAAEVTSACGKPLSQQESNQPVVQKVAVQQFIYNNKGTNSAFYGVWNLPTGNGGAQLEINIVNKKVKSIKLNSSGSNAVSICGGNSIQIDDPVERVYSSCGNPSLTNNTYINEVVPSAEKPQIWIYQPGQYQPSVSLTFVNGRLQSIN